MNTEVSFINNLFTYFINPFLSKVMANHWMELSSSFVSFGAIERDPELFV